MFCLAIVEGRLSKSTTSCQPENLAEPGGTPHARMSILIIWELAPQMLDICLSSIDGQTVCHGLWQVTQLYLPTPFLNTAGSINAGSLKNDVNIAGRQ